MHPDWSEEQDMVASTIALRLLPPFAGRVKTLHLYRRTSMNIVVVRLKHTLLGVAREKICWQSDGGLYGRQSRPHFHQRASL